MIENEPDARPKAMPMVAMNRVTAIEVRSRPCSLLISKKWDFLGVSMGKTRSKGGVPVRAQSRASR
ncbi:hypothetical protein D3C81_1941160 [compost metagenome]